ncbi:Ribonuclease Y [Sedimentisphaera cyanobacteriorum]|uniref:Ribonuclease Y n=1 Tax=Sedimentisphaera cyanobacteriorum TaxID=1940790 RepID=A0A1Q2HPZ0_9BACT|nr:ribonuclease Y [Sedimentisphaera cyanobacteriorum]AQQ09354.1 Ribonuclease Y [Sedimentisphaera cyanobacteriorum]
MLINILAISPILVGGGAAVVSAIATFAVIHSIAVAKQQTLKHKLDKQTEEAKKEAEEILKTARIDASSEFMKRREEFEKECNQVRKELRDQEKRLSKREDANQRQTELFAEKEKEIAVSQNEIQERQKRLSARETALTDIIAEQKKVLLQITGMNVQEAKELLLQRLEDECEHDMNVVIRKKVEEANETAERKSREIISSAIQRFSAEQCCESTVSIVDIPNDDMKGRIIGREGRNIRAFEKATGVDVIVDDTPGVIVVSGFDPVRREVARLTMERLIQDGRIHPTHIEGLVEQTRKDVDQRMLQIGKETATEMDVRGLSNKVLGKIGVLRYRSSYGQNALQHSIEVAYLSQVMADELGLDGSMARRAGFLHDIGKAIDHEHEGGHPAIGAEFLRKFNESPVVLNAVAGHHGDIAPDNPYTPLVAAADAISASRPGARRETLERYIKRLRSLEEIGNSFKGVSITYAIQAGREIRVIVNADEIDDNSAEKIARDIATKIENEMTYPGEIKVTLLREVKCVEFAK